MSEIGKRYGNLVVLKKTDKRDFTNVVYLCKCDCGNLKEVSINKLHTGHTKSCGCRKNRIKDLTGQKFGKVTVIEFIGRVDSKTLWRCKCDCGNEFVTSTRNLTTGDVVSCGCVNAFNRQDVYNRNKGFVDGTSLYALSPTRKMNRNNSSGVKGVHYDRTRKRWVAQITFKRKCYNLGRFKTKEEAITARLNGEKKYFGDYR